MVSSKDQAKKISRGLRQLSKKFFEDFYAKAEEARRFPSSFQAMDAFGRMLKRATETEEKWPPQPHPFSTDEFEALLSPRLFQQVYHEALDAYGRHTPGLPKIPAGRPRQDALADEAAQLKEAGLSYTKIAVRLNRVRGLKPDNKDYATGESIRKLLKRRETRQAPHPDKTQG